MIQTPYKVYYKTRPLKICFLLDKDKTTFNDVQKTISYCYRLWGGRYNPILLTDGNTLSSDNWEFLKSYDPDIIKSNMNLNVELVKEIEKYLSPYYIEISKDDEKEYNPHYTEFPAEISLNPDNIKVVGNDYFTHPTISLFCTGFTKLNNEDIINFIDLNFSLYDNTLMNEMALGNNPHELYLIKDKKSIIESLDSANRGRKKVFQSQLSSISSTIGEPENHEDKEFGFSIIIGDTIQDLLYFWNRIFSLSSFHETVIRQLWIPLSVAKDIDFTGVLKKFIEVYSYESWQQHNHIKFISTSVKKNELEEIVTNLTKGLYSHNEIINNDCIKLPKLNNSMYYKIKDNKYKKLYELEDTFEVETPKQISDPSNHYKWAVDLFIEYNSTRFENIHGVDYWFQFPRKNWLSNFTNLNSRINLQGFITTFPSGKVPKIKLRIYEDYYIFQNLLTEHLNYYPHSDPRNSLEKHLFKGIKISDKGESLLGILNLFGGLFNAHNYLSERYWRKIFDIMTNRIKTTNENRAVEIKKIILEKYKDVKSIDEFNDKKIDFLFSLIMRYSTSMINSNIEICFDILEKIAIEEINEYNAKNKDEGNTIFEYDKRDLISLIDSLIFLNILFIGVKPQCPRCGLKNWIQIDEVKTKVNCIGCKYEFNIDSESKWYYKLNRLFEIGYSQKGLMPVILVLGNLMEHISSSFLFSPSLELYDEFDDTIYREKNIKPKHEVDILCIRDGEFIIGEVKQTNKLFKKSDFDDMFEISRRIKPDKVIFSSLDGKPSKYINDCIIDLRNKLMSFNIKVEWFELSSFYFEPSIVR